MEYYFPVCLSCSPEGINLKGQNSLVWLENVQLWTLCKSLYCVCDFQKKTFDSKINLNEVSQFYNLQHPAAEICGKLRLLLLSWLFLMFIKNCSEWKIWFRFAHIAHPFDIKNCVSKKFCPFYKAIPYEKIYKTSWTYRNTSTSW